VPQLLNEGWDITVFDKFWYGKEHLPLNSNLKLVEGDVRDIKKVSEALQDKEFVLHLACISNDASFELDEKLSTSVNLDSFEPLVVAAKKSGVKRFVFASSSSVYGVSDSLDVTEDHPLVPLTLYNKYKGMCEPLLLKHTSETFIGVVFRPATVCGYSPRQRLDLVVNILTNLAYHNREITIFGGNQLRPNIHIQDMVRAYELFINIEDEKVNGKIFNIGFENLTVNQLAAEVQKVIGSDVKIKKLPTNDNRSYHISSKKIQDELGFVTNFSILNAIEDLKHAFEKKLLSDCLINENYFNIKKMQSINLK
jgi:nucleoside-diphosphate-sugar epimerase